MAHPQNTLCLLVLELIFYGITFEMARNLKDYVKIYRELTPEQENVVENKSSVRRLESTLSQKCIEQGRTIILFFAFQ